ncbi:unnamed protein product [Prunus armeniaca]
MKVKMRTILLSRGLWSFVERGHQELGNQVSFQQHKIEKFEAEVTNEAIYLTNDSLSFVR